MGTSHSSTEWSLLPEVVELILQGHRLLVDLFTTHMNFMLLTFVSPFQHPLTWEVDALNLSWEELDAYAFPPTKILSKVINKVTQHYCRILLVAPHWPKQPWFAEVQDLFYAQPWELPFHKKLLGFHCRMFFTRTGGYSH